MSCRTVDGVTHAAVTFGLRTWPLCEIWRGTRVIAARRKGSGRPRRQPARDARPSQDAVTCAACLADGGQDVAIWTDSITTRRRAGVSPLTVLRWEGRGWLSFTALRHPMTARRMYTSAQLEEMRALAKKNGATGVRAGDRLLRRAEACLARLGVDQAAINQITTVTWRGVCHALKRWPRYNDLHPWRHDAGQIYCNTACDVSVWYSGEVQDLGRGAAALCEVTCASCLVETYGW